MTIEKIIFLAKQRAKSIILAGLLVGALSFAGLVISQKSFVANSDLLVVQNQQGFSDYYALSKSADYLSNVLMESLYSEKFLDEMNNTNMINSPFLPSGGSDRLKEWQKVLKVKKNPNAGILTIQIFGDNQKQVAEVSNAVLDVLTKRSFLFLGQGQNIEVRVLTGPIIEKNPSVLNLVLAGFGGFIIGLLLMLMWVIYSGGSQSKMNSNISLKDPDLLSEEDKQRLDYWSKNIR